LSSSRLVDSVLAEAKSNDSGRVNSIHAWVKLSRSICTTAAPPPNTTNGAAIISKGSFGEIAESEGSKFPLVKVVVSVLDFLAESSAAVVNKRPARKLSICSRIRTGARIIRRGNKNKSTIDS
jgi:hypothetical protein